MKFIKLKVGKMKKHDDCVVYPGTRQWVTPTGIVDSILVQGDRLAMLVNPETGAAIADWKHSGTVSMLCSRLNQTPIQLTDQQLQAILNARYRSGDSIAGCNAVKIV